MPISFGASGVGVGIGVEVGAGVGDGDAVMEPCVMGIFAGARPAADRFDPGRVAVGVATVTGAAEVVVAGDGVGLGEG